MFFCVGDMVKLVCWSGTLVLNFSFNSVDCLSGLSMIYFVEQKFTVSLYGKSQLVQRFVGNLLDFSAQSAFK